MGARGPVTRRAGRAERAAARWWLPPWAVLLILRRRLADPAIEVRVAAVHGVGEQGRPGVRGGRRLIRRLAVLTRDGDPAIREAACAAIGRLGVIRDEHFDMAAAAVLPLLSDGAAGVRWRAASVAGSLVGRRWHRAAADGVAGLLADPAPLVRLAALRALRKMLSAAAGTGYRRSVRNGWGAAELKPIIERLLVELRANEGHLGEAAGEAFEYAFPAWPGTADESRRTVEELLDLLLDERAEVRRNIVSVLYVCRAARHHLLEVLADTAAPARLREAAGRGLAACADSVPGTALRDSAVEPGWQWLADFVGDGSAEAVRTLAALYEDLGAADRTAVRAALQAMVAGGPLEDALRCATALETLGVIQREARPALREKIRSALAGYYRQTHHSFAFSESDLGYYEDFGRQPNPDFYRIERLVAAVPPSWRAQIRELARDQLAPHRLKELAGASDDPESWTASFQRHRERLEATGEVADP